MAKQLIATENISCTLDLESDGKRLGNLNLQFSDNQHAFDSIPIPIAVIKNGKGPTVLLSAGNHGDEYEGQVILRRMIHQLEAGQINGRLIILPALNYPAVLADSRLSPLDQGNLNRSFPGDEFGSPTANIAHFITTQLLPLADAGIDLHSGGTRTYYLPMAFLCSCEDPAIMQKSQAMCDAFNAPFTLLVRGEESSTGFDPVAQKLGVPFISAELNGGANVDIAATRIGLEGVNNVLRQLGVLSSGEIAESNTRYLDGIGGLHHVTAAYSGIFEPAQELGDQVSEGDLAGYLYSTEEIERAPLQLTFSHPGIIAVKRNGARVRRGGHVFLLAQEIDRADMADIISRT
ncbi:MAG: putative deacylase [Planctomycetota bacterium]|jgi:predicted deacylase